MEKVLITGISGGQGRLLARRLLGLLRGLRRRPGGLGGAARRTSPSTRWTCARRSSRTCSAPSCRPPSCTWASSATSASPSSVRHDVNVRGTKQLLDHCANYGVQKLVVISSSYVYGASPENPFYMDEDFPLGATRSYPEIRDLVEVDTLASAFIWKYPHIRTAVLRPVNVLGYYVHSMIGEYLRQRARADRDGLRPDDAVHPRGGRLGGDRAHARARAAGRLQRRRTRGRCRFRSRFARPAARALPLPEPLMRPLIDRLFRWGLVPYPAGRDRLPQVSR